MKPNLIVKPHLPLLTPKQDRRKAERQFMTIGIAWICDFDGIVLSADTLEVVDEYLKRSQPKIAIRPHDIPFKSTIPRAVFVGAGDCNLIDSLVDKLWSVMADKNSVDEMVYAAEEKLLKTYSEWTPLYPSGVPGVNLLVGVWARPHELELIRISGPVLNRKIYFDSIGCGKYFSGYIAKRLLRPKISFKDAIPIAIYMIDEAKANVLGCGGNTQVVALSNEGEVTCFSQDSIEEKTKQLRHADLYARRLVDLAIREDMSDEHFDTLSKQWLDELRKLRKRGK
jgi:hypothetical protein